MMMMTMPARIDSSADQALDQPARLAER
jgi:hypothetical protein